jgi:hypothetical protein
MSAFSKVNQFVEDLASGVHQFQTGTTHVLKVVLTNTDPTSASEVLADITELSTANGYTAGGVSVGTITGAQTSGTFKLVGGSDPSWTASGGSIGPFRYAVLYNDTPTSPADPLIGYWDYGTAITITSGNSFTVDLNQTDGILTVA